MPLDVQVLEQPAVAAAALDPRRSQILATLAEPGSATTVAQALGLPRQKVNYHLRLLEEHGLVELVEERPRRGLTERVVQATARGYIVSPAALGPSGADPERTDRLSSRYLLAVAARLVGEVGRLAARAEATSTQLATLTLDTEIRFASAPDRAAFSAELGEAITTLVSRYHDESASGGRWHRLVIASHPRPGRQSSPAQARQEIDHDRRPTLH
ncbi:MAG: helix-turn-helix domain-containing protein [Ornithinimicrobium sp.]